MSLVVNNASAGVNCLTVLLESILELQLMATAQSFVDLHLPPYTCKLDPPTSKSSTLSSNANISFGCILTFTEAEYLTYVH